MDPILLISMMLEFKLINGLKKLIELISTPISKRLKNTLSLVLI